MKYKRANILFLACIFSLSLINLTGQAGEGQPGGQTVLRSISVGDTLKPAISGLNLGQHSFSRFFQYLSFGTDRHVLLGQTASGQVQLALYSVGNKKCNTIAEYPKSVASLLQNAKFMVFFMHKLGPAKRFLLLTYDSEKIMNEKKVAWTQLDIFIGGDNGFSLLKKAETEKCNLLLSDVNEDGYTDILLWKKMALKPADKSSESTSQDKKELVALVFNPGNMTFEDGVLFRSQEQLYDKAR